MGTGKKVPNQGALLLGLQALVDLDGIMAGQGGKPAFLSALFPGRPVPGRGVVQGGTNGITNARFA